MANNAEDLKMIACEAIDEAADDLNILSQDIWNHPELCFEEKMSHDIMCSFLEKYGFPVERHFVVHTAFRSTIGEQNVSVVNSEQNFTNDLKHCKLVSCKFQDHWSTMFSQVVQNNNWTSPFPKTLLFSGGSGPCISPVWIRCSARDWLCLWTQPNHRMWSSCWNWYQGCNGQGWKEYRKGELLKVLKGCLWMLLSYLTVSIAYPC